MTHPHTDSKRAMLLLVCALCIQGVRSAPTPADAVQAAHAVALPDKDAILQAGTAEADKTFEGFGGVHPEKATEEKALYQSGMGALYEPAVGSVVRCRDREDPTCRAIQILDRGFPERPPISDDILIGRDEVVGNAEGNPAPDIDNGTAGCRPVIVETKPTESTETCRAGRPFEDKTCRRGVQKIGDTLARRFSCGRGEPTESSLTCHILASLESTSDFIERCFFGKEAVNDTFSLRETLSATARATWPVTCTAPQATSETVTCDEILVIETVPVCKPGSSVTSTVKDNGALTTDACPQGDQVTTTHTCGNGSKVRFDVAGFSAVNLRPKRSGTLRHTSVRECKAVLKFLSESCSGEACVASWKANITYNNYPLGTMEGKFIYPDDSQTVQKETWIDNCHDLRGGR